LPTQQQKFDTVEVPVSLPAKLHDHLRYLSRVDGLSVPAVIRSMIDNEIRHRKASDPEFRTYTRRSA
jgi:hypothetical protein